LRRGVCATKRNIEAVGGQIGTEGTTDVRNIYGLRVAHRLILCTKLQNARKKMGAPITAPAC